MSKRFVAYYRVSKEWGKELATQKRAVKRHLKDLYPPLADFTETETGKPGQKRPELRKAVDYCRQKRATLIVAKLDRLIHDLQFTGSLQKAEINFVCCDMPEATRETISLMVAVNRREREQASKRIKEALGAKRKKGVLLGANNPKVQAGLMKWRKKKVLERVKQAKDKVGKKTKKSRTPIKRELADKRILQPIKTLLKAGYSYKKIAYAFNLSNTPTRQGKRWTAVQVFRVVKRNNLFLPNKPAGGRKQI